MTGQPLVACEYKTGKTLGQGSYATVKEAVRIVDGKRFAAKMISKQLMKGREHMILNEIEILKKISKGHRNVLTLHDYFETPSNLYLVMDLCTGGELFDRICQVGQFYERDAAKIIFTTLDAVAYLHSLNVVHRDLKPENLLFKTADPNSELLIADYGLSKLVGNGNVDGFLKTTCGTPGYMAPEIIEQKGHGKPVDLWAIGVMTYFLLCGYLPFQTNNSFAETHLVLKAEFSFDQRYWGDVSDAAKDFICKLIVLDPAKRMTAVQALEHPWIKDQEKIVAKDLLPNIRQGFDARKTLKRAFAKIIAVNTFKRGNMQADTPLNLNLKINAGNGYQMLKSPMDISVNGSRESLVESESTLADSSPLQSPKVHPPQSIHPGNFDVVP